MAEYTLLQIVTEFCHRKGLPPPATVVGAQDDATLQMWGLMNEGIQDIASRYNHQQLQTKLSFNPLSGPGWPDYLVWDLRGSTFDWKHMIPGTMWNATNRLKMEGPLTPREWQQVTTMLTARSLYAFSLFGNGIHIFPTPPYATIFTCYYQSKYGVYNPTAAPFEEFYNSDQSSPRLPTSLILSDLKWRWAKEKGLPYAEDQRTSEAQLANAVGADDQGDLVMDGADYAQDAHPAIVIPPGNWFQ